MSPFLLVLPQISLVVSGLHARKPEVIFRFSFITLNWTPGNMEIQTSVLEAEVRGVAGGLFCFSLQVVSLTHLVFVFSSEE